MTAGGRRMSDVREVLIVGGGIGGMSLAICLTRLGVQVDLIDSDTDWRAVGAGLSLNGATLKAFKQVGVLERMRAEGHMHSAFALHLPSGQLLQRIQPPDDGSGTPSGGGILRPVLHQILADATRAAGTRVRLGVRLNTLEQQGVRVRTVCSDAEEATYDLVVGADGLHSQVREMIFPDAPAPRFTGQGCWRAVFPRPPEFDCVAMYIDTHHKAGLNPVSEKEMYLFLLETVDGNQRMPEEQWPQLLAERMQPFGGPLAELRATLNEGARINYRPLETLLLPSPWFRRNVLLIGDAAHATTPHSAYGCGLAVEDAVVLAELLEQEHPLPHLLQRFMERRFERCRVVVEGSVKLGDLEMAHAPMAEHQAVNGMIARAIAQPI
jgi:2-polyprenyl-6-methoxyphenol hydroxylase-like FAD-dependent oxidoreductase